MEPSYYLTKSLEKLAKGKWEKHDGTYETIVWVDTKDVISKEVISEEANNVKIDYEAKKYQRDRASQYPSIQDQLDMQYWDAVNGTNKWQEAVAKVKTDNPKPE